MSHSSCWCGHWYCYHSGTRGPLDYLRNNTPSYREACDIAEAFPKAFSMPRDLQRSSDCRDTYGESNLRVWRQDHAETEGLTWWDLGNAVLVRTFLITQAQRDALEGLESYPILDESDHSDLEQAYEVEDWKDYGRHDFERALVARVDARDREHAQDIVDAAEQAKIDSLYWDWCSAVESYAEHESNGTSFNVESLIKAVTNPKQTWYYADAPRWDGSISGLQDILDPYAHDTDGADLWVACADSYTLIQLIRESELRADGSPDMARIRDEHGDLLDCCERYIVVRASVRETGDETVLRFKGAA